MTVNGTGLTVKGTITAEGGKIAKWDINDYGLIH
jgi:hypothetical protein